VVQHEAHPNDTCSDGHCFEMSCPENARYLTNAGCQHSPANAIGSRDEAVRWCDEALAVVEAELAKMIASVDRRCRWDVYTGLGGYALMYLRLSESEAAGRGRAEALLGKARVCVDLAMRLCGDDPKAESLLCGPLGIFAIAAVVLARQGDRTSAAAHVAKIRQALRSGVQEPQATSDELLYGRAGWLTVALFVNAHLDPALRVEDDVLRPIVAAILAKGERTAATEPRAPSDPTWTLLFRWHGKAYLGAAHGTAGIVQTLLCRPDLLPPGGLALLHKTIHELIDAATANGGHLPSSLHSTPSSSGRLVQWCHGSPGFCLMLCRACAVFKDDPELLNQARIAANMTWKRGLLRKGVVCSFFLLQIN